MNARTEILDRVRRASADISNDPALDAGRIPRAYASSPMGIKDHVGLFAERVADYHAVVERVAVADVPTRISAVVAGWPSGVVVVPPDLHADWVAAIESAAPVLRDDPPVSLAELDASAGVVTTAALGIALTGTIVLDAGVGMGRRAVSLLPDRHLCLVPAGAVVAGVPEAMAALDPARPITFISGPSATSDIELDRVEGVHGPRTLHVLIID